MLSYTENVAGARIKSAYLQLFHVSRFTSHHLPDLRVKMKLKPHLCSLL